jgi:hypothetical protein
MQKVMPGICEQNQKMIAGRDIVSVVVRASFVDVIILIFAEKGHLKTYCYYYF